MRYKFSEEQLRKAVTDNLSIAGVCRALSIRPVGGNYKTLKAKFLEFGISTEHFTGAAWNVGHNFRKFAKEYILDDILVIDSEYRSSNSLKKRLIREGLLVEKCQICGISDWNGKKLVLDLDHINGVNTDNRLENLRLLCPNCHSQTDTYKGKCKSSALSKKREVEYRKFGETLTCNDDGNPEPSPSNREGVETLHGTPKSKRVKKPVKICHTCQAVIHNNSTFCSNACKYKAAAGNVPSLNELLTQFDIHKSFVQVGKHFNVSNTAVKKWCVKYDILDMVKRKSRPQTGNW